MEHLERELRRKTVQLAALREISQAINTARALQDILELITLKTTRVMGVESCSLYLLEEDTGDLVLLASTGLAPASLGQARLRVGEGLTGWTAQTGEPVAVADAARDPRFKYLPETGESIFQSLLAVPLVSQERIIGAMNVQTRGHKEFSADEVELLALIADLAAGTLEKAVLYERMQRQVAELSALAEVSEAAASPLYLDEILSLIIDMAARVMQAKACTLMLLDEERGELVVRATQGLSQAYRDLPPVQIGRGIAGQVAQSGQPLAVDDVRHDPRYPYPDLASQEGLGALLSVPLRVRGRVIGVLDCYTGTPHRFGPGEIALLSTLANQTALAIENARLVTNVAVVREMHHRIKNNLQSVAMLLRMQMGENGERTAREVLCEAINRIGSIAAVHEVLSQKGFRLVDTKELLTRVARGVVANMAAPGFPVEVNVEGISFALPSQPATLLALAVNELVQNAMEHAFVGRDRAAITIHLGEDPASWVITVRDDGVGVPESRSRRLGLQIVETLVVEDLRGKLTLVSSGGTTATIRIPQQ